ncbi:hypothetical protein SLS62_007549 [Diatrype stigma]|uniref:CENP-V/GFA domain-containing protein n=1 Tax=Diatrype stigma TaxID=117547 RepID=A0AAN9YQL1_9PEZI
MAAGPSPQALLKTYRGSCHCGAYIYDVELPEVVEKASECNCSVCFRKGSIWTFPVHPKFLRGDQETLTNYTFGRKLFNHKFCPTCGICLMIVGHAESPKDGEEPQTGLNLRTIQHGQGVDVWKLNLISIDGASFPPPYQPHEYTGPQPKGDVEGGKNGSLWIFPSKDEVEIQGRENQGVYTFGLHAWGKTFCKKCGTPVGNEPMPVTGEQLARFPEGYRTFYLENSHMRPINLRILDGVDVKKLNIVQMQGYDRPPAFVEPQP